MIGTIITRFTHLLLSTVGSTFAQEWMPSKCSVTEERLDVRMGGLHYFIFYFIFFWVWQERVMIELALLISTKYLIVKNINDKGPNGEFTNFYPFNIFESYCRTVLWRNNKKS